MQIKRTRILHKRYTLAEWEQHDLKQGEIGSLIDDSGSIIETRIGTHNIQLDNGTFTGQKFQNALLLGTTENIQASVQQYRNRQEFPSIPDEDGNVIGNGNIFTLYIDKSTNSVWRWDEDTLQYICMSASPGNGDGWWTAIYGGGATLKEGESLGSSTINDIPGSHN